jgi:DNA excision repair protein ERCC-4
LPKRPSRPDFTPSSPALNRPQIVIDAREQLPYEFDGAITKTLDTADYSVEGLEHCVAFERKSLNDLLGCIGGSRDRFERELERLSQIRYRGLIVEATLLEVLRPPPFSRLHPNSILGTLASWSLRFQLPIWFGGTRSTAQSLTERLLVKAAQYAGEGDAIEKK